MDLSPGTSVPDRLEDRYQEGGNKASCKAIVIKIHAAVNNAYIKGCGRMKKSCYNTRYNAELTGNRCKGRGQ